MRHWQCVAVAVAVMFSRAPVPEATAQSIPKPAHIVIVVE
jgi:hypothetical protein